MCEKEQRISLVGIGMGTEDGVTVRVQQIIRSCDCLIGAQRMLDCAQRICAQAVKNADTGKVREMQKTPGQKAVLVEYRPAEIISYIEGHPEFRHITVLLSGDTGFYSGAKRLAAQLAEQFRDNAPGEPRKCRIELAPGISSVAYLAARLGTSWEDAALVSLHGKDEDFIQTVDRNRKTILLLGGGQSGEKVLGRLKEYGMDHVTVHAGSRLSYEDERIVSGKPSELSEKDLAGLCTVLIENPFPERGASPHVRDGEFIRGRVPMTKEEVRAVSIARLQLTEDAVVWDVGAGTGSVSVEAARSGNRIRVYAVEKNPEALELIRENRKKFRADGIRIVPGEAPGVLETLEAPTHVFIGGSSGNLQEILSCVLEKNENARIVVNAISLETVKEVMEAAESGTLKSPEITQLTVSRSRELGRYHMMTGQNPVYIVSAGGTADERGEA